MKRITERVLIEFDKDDHRQIEKMLNKASIIQQELSSIARIFVVGSFDPDKNEWSYTDIAHPTMSRKKLMDDLDKMKKHAEALFLDLDSMRERTKLS